MPPKKPSSSKATKRKDTSLSDKIVVLDKMKAQPAGTSQRRLAELLDLPKSSIARLAAQEQSLRERWAAEEAQSVKSGKRKRDGKDPEVDAALSKWFSSVLERGQRVSGSILKAKAEIFAQKFGRPDFVATEGWLARWKTRRQIKFKRSHGEKGSADSVEEETWKSTVLPQLLDEYTPSNIYNTDDTIEPHQMDPCVTPMNN
jgi:hypothetical protein